MLFLQLPNVDTEKLQDADSTVKARIETQIDSLTHMTPEEAVRTVSSWMIEVVLKLLAVIAIWYIGRWLIRKLKKFLSGIFERRHVDPSLRNFLQSFISISLTIILLFIVVNILGLNTTSFLALFASAGLAIGVALSGTLQNFAGGIMLLLLKPFRVGDYIVAQDQSGTVQSIQLFNTTILTPDNQAIIIPNGPLSTGIINNTSHEPIRQVSWTIPVKYGEDYEKVFKLAQGLLEADDRVFRDKAMQIVINDFNVNTVNIAARVWVKASDFWGLFYDMNERLLITLRDNGITFPYQVMNVNVADQNDIPNSNVNEEEPENGKGTVPAKESGSASITVNNTPASHIASADGRVSTGDSGNRGGSAGGNNGK